MAGGPLRRSPVDRHLRPGALGAQAGRYGEAAALRKSSILFAAIIAIVVLKERFTRSRALAVGLIGAGAAVLLASAG